MTRRTTGWKARNKKYHFFLFTDVLLWTSRVGILRNIVKLYRCKLSPSDAKTDRKKKFKILIDMTRRGSKQKEKLLLLECNSERQRETWYTMLENAITLAGKPKEQLQTVDKFDYIMENDSDEETSDRKDEPLKDKHVVHRSKIRRENPSEDGRTETQSLANEPYGAYHDRAESHNFIPRLFEGFAPMDDDESQCSEYDYSLFDKCGANSEVTNTSKFSLSPHRTSSFGCSFHGEKSFSESRKLEVRDSSNKELPSPTSCVIKRGRESLTRFATNEEIRVQRASSFPSRRSDDVGAPEPNFTISLSDLNDGGYV